MNPTRADVLLVCLASLLCLITPYFAFADSERVSVWDSVPAEVAKLLRWPDNVHLAGANRLRGDEDKYVAAAKRSSIDWIQKVISPDWLPEEVTLQETIMLRDEIGNLDVTRTAWERNGWTIQVSQTQGIMAIHLTAIKPELAGGADEQRKVEAARVLCTSLFVRNGKRWSQDQRGEGVKVEVADVAHKIARNSFGPEGVQRAADGVLGKPQSRREAGVGEIDNDDDVADDGHENLGWDQSRESWFYWWRHVAWLNDGNSIAFFLLKTEGGAWIPNYASTPGANWFDPPRQRNTPSTR